MPSIFSSVIRVHLFNRRALGAEGATQGGSQTDTEEYNTRVSAVTSPPSSSNLGAGFGGSRACLSEHALKRKAHFYTHMSSDFQRLGPSSPPHPPSLLPPSWTEPRNAAQTKVRPPSEGEEGKSLPHPINNTSSCLRQVLKFAGHLLFFIGGRWLNGKRYVPQMGGSWFPLKPMLGERHLT